MLHTQKHGSALRTSLFLNLTSDIKLNVPRSRKMSRSRPINVSVSVSSRTPNWTSRSRPRSREK